MRRTSTSARASNRSYLPPTTTPHAAFSFDVVCRLFVRRTPVSAPYFVEFNFTSQLEPMRSISVWEPTEPGNLFYWNGYPEFGSFGADRCLDTATGVDGLCRCAYLRCLSLFLFLICFLPHSYCT